MKMRLLSKIIYKIENLLSAKRSELSLVSKKNKLIIFLPGLSGFVNRLFPLVNYVRQNQDSFEAVVIPLGGSFSKFSNLTDMVIEKVDSFLYKHHPIEEIIIFGHSHGGRVAIESVGQLIRKYPNVHFGVITAGTPVELMPNHNKLYVFIWKIVSNAIRQWPKIVIEDVSKLKYLIGFYSKADWVVPEKFAIYKHPGELFEIANVSHNDLCRPKYVGKNLLSILKER